MFNTHGMKKVTGIIILGTPEICLGKIYILDKDNTMGGINAKRYSGFL